MKSPDLVLSRAELAARGWGGHQEQPIDQNAPEADRRNVPDDVISVSDSEVDQDSSHSDESSYESGSSTSSGFFFPCWLRQISRIQAVHN